MPLNSLIKVRNALGSLNDKRILIMGISYRQDVADTRYSPSQHFYENAVKQGAQMICCDPLISHWDELKIEVELCIDLCPNVDAVVFAVPHKVFRNLQPNIWLGGLAPYILDANDCLTYEQRAQFSELGCHLESIGRGACMDAFGGE